jgi:hypothetical protein
VISNAGVDSTTLFGGATVDSQLPTNIVANIIAISAVTNLKTEGKSDLIIHLRCNAPNPTSITAKDILSNVTAPYLLCQASMLSNLVQAVAAPVITTVIALQRANSLNLGRAISFCSLFNCVNPNKPPTQKDRAIT